MTNKKKAPTTSVSSAKTSKTSALPLPAAKKLLIDLEDISVQYGAHQILSAISLCVHANECIGLIGPNGAGKTTLLRVLLGLATHQSGKVSRYTRSISYIPQRGAQAPQQVPMSVMEVVQLGAGGHTSRAKEALSKVKLAEKSQHRFDQLSGGQQQRVLIAKALASRSEVLILDEPTTGIDEASQADFFEILKQLQRQGITIIMVSHDIDAVLRQVDRVICLNRTILYDGSPENFEADQWLSDIYTPEHRRLHHTHGEKNV